MVRSGHPLLKKKKLALKDLVEHSWIMPSDGTVLRREIENAFHEAGLQVPVNTVESVSILTNRTLLMETDMIGSMPYQVVKTYEEVGLLKRLPVHLKANLGPVGYSVRGDRELTPAVQYFLQVLTDTAKGMGSSRISFHAPKSVLLSGISSATTL